MCLSISINQSVSSWGAQVTPSWLPLPIHPPIHCLSVCLSVCSQPSSEQSILTQSYASSLPQPPQQDPIPPLSAGSHLSSPSIPTPSSVSLICQSVCPSLHATSFLPHLPGPLSPLWVPSITSKTALPSQVVTSWRLPAVCLSVCPPAHPSIRLPSHPSCHSHLSILATTHLFSDGKEAEGRRRGPLSQPQVGVRVYGHICSHL